MTPTPPPGFTLDAPQDGGNMPPPPPPGFTLDQQQGQDQGSYWGDVGKHIVPDIGNIFKGLADQVKEGAYEMPKRALQTGIQMAGGIPYSETPSGQADTQFVQNAPAMGSAMVKPYTHLYDSFREQPINTALSWAPIAEAAYNKITPALASAADKSAMGLGRRSLGFTKGFLNTEGKEINANDAVRTAYENKIISPLTDPYEMRAVAKDVNAASGKQIGDILENYNQEPSRPQTASPGPQPQRLLPAPKSSSIDLGPENVSTDIPIPAYGGSGRYEYKAAGEGPQYESTEGPMSRPAPRSEIFNKSKLSDARSGKLNSTLPEPERISMRPPPDWLFDPKSAINEIENLRPKAKSGKSLFGGDYNSQHSIIDDATAMIKSYGDGPMTWDEANKLKGDLQGLVNYDSAKSGNANNLNRKVASTFLNNLDSQLSDAMVGQGKNPSIFKGAKRTFRDTENIQKGLQNKISSDKGNNTITLTDYIAGAAGGAAGGTPAAIGTILGKKLAQRYGTNTLGTGMYKAAEFLKKAPQIPNGVIRATAGAAAVEKILTEAQARKYLKDAGWDREEARRKAKLDGFTNLK